jgi:hypothetical protein
MATRLNEQVTLFILEKITTVNLLLAIIKVSCSKLFLLLKDLVFKELLGFHYPNCQEY